MTSQDAARTGDDPTEAASNGISRCLRCGSSSVTYDGHTLRCEHCRARWNTAVIARELELNDGIAELKGTVMFDGARDIAADAITTLACEACGAHVSVNTHQELVARCPWCRHQLTVNSPVGSGAVPDAILPFSVSRERAVKKIGWFLDDHSTHASSAFTRTFSADDVFPVYLPYLVADGKATVTLEGTMWDTVVFRGRDRKPEIEQWRVRRTVEVEANDLPIEARRSRSRQASAVSTANIVRAIQPFKVDRAVRFHANYLTDGTSFEPRDLGVDDAIGTAADYMQAIARKAAAEETGDDAAHDVGVRTRWERAQVDVAGTRWLTVLLPVWMYGHEERRWGRSMMHYIVVNGSTEETWGSIPMNRAKVLWSAWSQLLITVPFSAGLAWLAYWLFTKGSFAVSLMAALAAIIVGILLFVNGPGNRRRLRERHRNATADFAPEEDTSYVATVVDRSKEFEQNLDDEPPEMKPGKTAKHRAPITVTYTLHGTETDR